ncbi:MAG: helix-turn-helix transcriptional regulator [Lachnospiraceae bacterium]|nr:helix-turn-helix transcriptional regulator [Lachnospiraceae bacterium]
MQIVTNQFQKEIKQHGSDGFPFLVSHERLSKYEAGSFLWHWHPEIEITFIESGQMLYKVNQLAFHLKTGDMLFGNANTLHAGEMKNQQDCEYISITFSPRLIYGFYQSSICLKYVEPLTQDLSLSAIHLDYTQEWHTVFAALIKEMIALYENQQNFYELEISIRLQSLWKLILEHYTPANNASAHDKRDYDRIREIMNYVEQHFHEKITLEDISAHLHLCESECSRLFKRYMNLSLFSFLQEYRVERSLEYLADRNETVSGAAEKCGFADSNYYAKVFAKIKGISPSAYRKKLMVQ